MDLIATTDELAAACERFARNPFVSVDTEFLRETTFWPKLCVVQMASPDEAVVIDALAPEIDLQPLFRLMADEQVAKVFHAARQDIEIFWNLAKLVPAPLFDTQVAAMVLGHGDSISYDQLVQRITGDQIDKSSRFTDWSRRPLSPAQVHYAISDVTHLVTVYGKLKAELEKKGRADWVRDEMKVLSSPATYRQEPEHAWERLKSRVRKPKDLAVLIEIAAWREREAQARDLPRQRVLKDEALAEIAMQQPKTAEALANMRFLSRGFERSKTGEAILAAVAAGLARDPKTLPRLQRPRGAVERRVGHGGAPEGAPAHERRAAWRRRQGDRHYRRPREDRGRRGRRRPGAQGLAAGAVRRAGVEAQARRAFSGGRERPRGADRALAAGRIIS